jgi:psp operon transcriptional activator
MVPLLKTASTEALGQSEEFLEFQEQLSRVAKVERPVLIIGERGTGKELAASRIHYLSERWQESFIALNCASLTPTLVESELFGHEAGAFTGAVGKRHGRFEAADNGTLFLDEIGLIPLEVQEKILRVVEYGTFERVGGNKSVEVNVRLVSATNADLALLAKQGKFKADLLDRLAFEVIHVPPLRYRTGDIGLLTRHFAGKIAAEIDYDSAPVFSDYAIEQLNNHPWPGNIRELKNVVERAVYLSEGKKISSIVFDPFKSPYQDNEKAQAESNVVAQNIAVNEINETNENDFDTVVTATEKSLLKNALSKNNFNQKNAAASLGLSYHRFRGLLRKYGGPDKL